MKKTGAVLITLLLAFSLISLVLSEENDSNNTGGNSNDPVPTDKIELGFQCLEELAVDCSGLSVQELSYTILASPENIFSTCVNQLQSRKSENNFGGVRDTALAVLALQHAGEDTTALEEWLLTKTHTPTNLIWYLQEDSNLETECHIGYNTNDYTITISENKKINSDAGPCLTRAQSNFWLEVSPECYGDEISVTCDQQFITSLLYRNMNSPTIYVLEGTQNAAAFGQTETTVTSKCFGDSSCNYEATAWATMALLKSGHDIEEYIPYLIALSDSNEGYLPNAFIYMITNYGEYASRLVEERKLGNYWEADNSAYNKYYDTALAILSIGNSNSPQIQESKNWLFFSQGSNGCWQNSVRDTAFILWSLIGRPSTVEGGTVTTCSEGGFFCIPTSECPSAEQRGNYQCSSLSTTCCAAENLKSCSEYGGSICSSGESCQGIERRAIDNDNCCTGTCEEIPTETQCESNYYSCQDSCSDSQENIDYTCNQGQICCRTKPQTESGLSGWIWVISILILIVLGVILWIKRENVKLLWFKMKSKFKKDKSRGGQTTQGGGPRPPFPPRRGPPPRPPMPPQRRIAPQGKPPAPKEGSVFDELKRMSG